VNEKSVHRIDGGFKGLVSRDSLKGFFKRHLNHLRTGTADGILRNRSLFKALLKIYQGTTDFHKFPLLGVFVESGDVTGLAKDQCFHPYLPGV
jgi:hypothetical protein